MGASAPKTESIVKGGKPVVVREWLSPEYLTKLTELSSYYGNRALGERSTYQDMVNRQRTSQGEETLFSPMATTGGQVIEPGKVYEPYNAAGLVQAAQESNMFQPPRGGRKKKKEPREAYGDAIKNVQTNELYGYNHGHSNN